MPVVFVPVNESKIVRRARYPLEFELTGVPAADRDRLLAERRAATQTFANPEEGEEDAMQGVKAVTNSFAVDYQQGNNVVDINNPPAQRYRHQEYPKMLYHHESGHVLEIATAAQEAAAIRRGFQEKPAPGRDYSKVRSGMVAPVLPAHEEREKVLTAEDLEQLERDELAALEGDQQGAEAGFERDLVVDEGGEFDTAPQAQDPQSEDPAPSGRARKAKK